MRRGKTGFIVGFLSPAILLYVVFVVVPLLQAAQFSLYRWRGVSAKRTFVGLENFAKLLDDTAFHRSLSNALWLLVVSGLAIFIAGIAAAHALNQTTRTARLVRGIILFPQVISIVAVAVLWYFIFDPQADLGLMNGTLALFGIAAKNWLGDSASALPSVAVAFVWHAFGFYVLLFLAGIKAIDGETIEAASLDGSTGFHRFWQITWPLLWSVKRIATTYLIINVINVFALIILMTNGGNPDRHTEMPLSYLYEQAFDNSQFGYATSIAVVDFIIAMCLSVLVMLIYRRNPVEARR